MNSLLADISRKIDRLMKNSYHRKHWYVHPTGPLYFQTGPLYFQDVFCDDDEQVHEEFDDSVFARTCFNLELYMDRAISDIVTGDSVL